MLRLNEEYQYWKYITKNKEREKESLKRQFERQHSMTPSDVKTKLLLPYLSDRTDSHLQYEA